MRLLGLININHAHPTHDHPSPDLPPTQTQLRQRAARTAPESYPASTPQLSWWTRVGWPLSCSPSEVLLRTGLHPLIEYRTPDGPIALVERIHRCLSQTALVLVVPRAQTALSLPYKEMHGGHTSPGDTEIHLPRKGRNGQ